MSIPASALKRFEQLKNFAMIASATAEGLRPESDHWREQVTRLSIGLSDVRRNFGEVTVGSAGEAFIRVQRRTSRGSVGSRIDTYEATDERREDLDGYTLPIWSAQQRLAQVREQHAAAGERAGAFRRAVDEAKQALQARGWKGDR